MKKTGIIGMISGIALLVAVTLLLATACSDGTTPHSHAWDWEGISFGVETRTCDCGESEKKLTKNLGEAGEAGGKIIYRSLEDFTLYDNDPSNDKQVHYLEVWTDDEIISSFWGDQGTMVAGITTLFDTWPYTPTGLYIGHGLRDTQRIVIYMDGKSISNIAAQIARTGTRGGKSDWFLPSIDELNEIYKLYESKGKGTYGNLGEA